LHVFLLDRLPRFWRSDLPVSPRARLIRFIGAAIALLVIVSIVWYVIDPPYNRLLVAVTDPLTSLRIALGDSNNHINFYLENPPGAKLWINGAGFHFGLILVSVLIAVTPGLTLLRRIKFIAIALGVMFVIHIITILIFAWIIQSSDDPVRFAFSPWVTFLVTIGTQLFPALIWVILCLKYWFPRAEAAGAKRVRKGEG
jgi:hypothetical protein